MITYLKRVIRSHIYVIVLITLFGCSRDHHDHPDLTTGKELFDYHCADCHGVDGTGRIVDLIPANILTTKSQKEVVEFIISGADHEKMPIFKTMPEREAGRIAYHLFDLRNTYDKKSRKEKKFRELLLEP
jgi:cytochrome c553